MKVLPLLTITGERVIGIETSLQMTPDYGLGWGLFLRPAR